MRQYIKNVRIMPGTHKVLTTSCLTFFTDFNKDQIRLYIKLILNNGVSLYER